MGLAKALLRVTVVGTPSITRAVPADSLTDVAVSWSKGTYTLTVPSSNIFDNTTSAIVTARGTSAFHGYVDHTSPGFVRIQFKNNLGATQENDFTIVFF